MNLIRGLQLLGVVVFAIDQIVDRRRHERLRAVHRAWRETARILSAEERREVGRAVRTGTAVHDPWLAEPAMEFAAALLAYPPRTPLRRVGDVVFATWITAPTVIFGFRQQWGWMAYAALWPLLFGLLAYFAPRFRYRSAEALDANRRILPPQERAARVVDELPSLAVGLPRSVARARRMRNDS